MTEKKPIKTRSDYAEDALYREIWEDVHTQKTYEFVKKHSKILIIIVVGVLFLAIVNQIYNSVSNSNQKKYALDLETAMTMIDEKQYTSAHSVLETLAKKSSTAMGDIARYQDAIVYAKEQNAEMYLKTLEKLAKNGNTRDYKHLAIIRLALIKADDMTGREMEKELSPVLTTRSPFYFTALWLIATKYESENNEKMAVKFYKKIQENKKAPAIISAQTESSLSAMGQLKND